MTVDLDQRETSDLTGAYELVKWLSVCTFLSPQTLAAYADNFNPDKTPSYSASHMDPVWLTLTQVFAKNLINM